MGVRTTASEKVVAIFDSVSGYAFGPTFYDEEAADSFLAFADGYSDKDLRAMTDAELSEVYESWLKERERLGESS